MSRIPFLGRLFWWVPRQDCLVYMPALPIRIVLTLCVCRTEYLALFASLSLVFLEETIRIITSCLRTFGSLIAYVSGLGD